MGKTIEKSTSGKSLPAPPVINHTIASCACAKINKFLLLCFRISCFYDFVTKSLQNKQIKSEIFGCLSIQSLMWE